MPCHHKLESYLQQYIDTLEATALEAGSPLDSKAWTFPTAAGRSGRLSNRPMGQADVYRMIRRRALGRGHRDENRLPQLPRHRHHGVFAERGANSKWRSRWPTTNPPAPPGSTTDATTRSRSTSRADPDLKSNHWWLRQHFPLPLRGRPRALTVWLRPSSASGYLISSVEFGLSDWRAFINPANRLGLDITRARLSHHTRTRARRGGRAAACGVKLQFVA